MSQQVQELINKIKSEGIQEADQKAKVIEDRAQHAAHDIIDDAKKKADHLLLEAQEDIKKMRESTHAALKQASRDMLLSLRKEIEKILQSIVAAEVSGALTPEHLSDLIGTIVKASATTQKVEGGIEVVLNPKDLKGLKQSFIAKLQKQVKQPIHFEASEDIGKGFTISFDKGKSCYDFSDAGLTEYLSTYLNPHVSALLKDSVSSKNK
jgi:V/A-type H+/Na+-transporting ATPase subunit E